MSSTMEDVARQTGLSKSTVSLALNDKPGISPETKEAVLEAAKKLGYSLPENRPLRRSPAKRKNFTVVSHAGHEPYDEIYGLFLDYLQGIQTFAQEADIHITAIGGYRKGSLNRLETRILTDQNVPVDGLLLMGKGVRQDSQLLHRALELQIPVVVLSRDWPDLPVSTVSQDHHQQTKIALDYLEQLGHRQIAFLANEGEQAYEWCVDRLGYYRDKMKELNQKVDEELIVLGKNGAESVRELLTRKPDTTAIFAIHDERAIEAMQGVMDMGLEVPKDISVIGLDNSVEPPVGFPRLTTVGFSHFDIGYLATELLLRQIENDNLCFGKLSIGSALIERDSCGKPRDF
jgi:LacI family transcriptional regulator, repressor for deo operon, udp, cdd, tsx, nupC, and nupG